MLAKRWKARAGLAQALVLAAAAGSLVAAEDGTDRLPGAPGDSKDQEKPKEPPLKYSAWCAFRDLSDTRTPPKEDPTKEYTRAIAERWTGFARRGQWANIILELKNTTEKSEFKGTATIRFDPVKENEQGVTPYQTYYRQDFEVGPDTVKQYSFSVLCPETGWSSQPVPVSITAKGVSYVRYVQLQDLDALGEDFVVVVSESAGAFRHLATRQRNIEDERQRHERRVAVVEPQELPGRWHDLTLANLIVIDGPPREQLTDSQWAALKSYVQAGGQVLITAGKDPSRLKGPVEELAGITVRGMLEVSALDGEGSEDLNWAPKDPSWKLPLADITVSPKGSPTVWYSQATRKVEKCQRFYGLGSVTFLPFSLSDPRLENWPGRALIPERLLEEARGRRLFLNTTADDDITGDVSGPRSSGYGRNPRYLAPEPRQALSPLMTLRQNLDDAFAKHTPVQTQPQSTVLSFLLLYLLCVVPGNYLLFGWLRRREIAWLAVPVWAATFSVIAYVVGYMGQTGRLTASEAAVIEAGQGQGMGVARTFVGLYAPQRNEYRIEFPLVRAGKGTDERYDMQAAPGHLVNIGWNRERGLDTQPLYLVDDGQGLSVEKFLVQQRSTRQMEIVHRVQIGGGLDVTVRHSKDSAQDKQRPLDIELQNNTGFALYNPVYVYEGKAYALGSTPDNALPPGASNKACGLVAGNGVDPNQAFFGRVITPPSARGPLAHACAAAFNEYVRNQIGKFRQGVICAWLDNEKGVLPVKVAAGWREAKEPSIAGLSLLLVPVKIKADIPLGRPEFRISYGPNYKSSTSEGKWSLVAEPIQLKPDTVEPQRNQYARQPQEQPVVAYLKVQLPGDYRSYSDADRKLQIQFKLGVKTPGSPVAAKKAQKPSAPRVNGDLTIAVRKQGGNDWLEVYDQVLTPNTSSSVRAVLPWDNYQTVSNDNAMTLKIGLTVTGGQTQGPQLEEIECKAGPP